jgi:hypothetical protein
MTLRELRNTISKSILPQLDDGFQASDTLIYKDEKTEILRGLFFEKSKAVKGSLYIYSFVMPLMIKKEDLSFNFGARIKNSNGTDLWDFKKEVRETSLRLLINSIEKQELLIDVFDSKSFINYYSSKVSTVRDMEAITYCCCYADVNHFKLYLEKFIEFINENGNLTWAWVEKIKRRALNDSEKLPTDFKVDMDEIVEENWIKVKKGWYN